nr:MAG TPA: hypothetical protein [Caudoviricetes sp.]
MAVDDYFFTFCISLPSIYPALPHNATSAINTSYDKVIIGKIPFLNYGTITIYVDWACTPRLERTVLPFLVVSYEVLYHITTYSVKIPQNKRIIKYTKIRLRLYRHIEWWHSIA